MDAGTMSISDQRGYTAADVGGSFTEDAPRPPVPGEEGELVCSDGRQCTNLSFCSKSDGFKCEASVATPRRPDLDLGYEPEGSASPTPPYVKWAESLHSLLDDQDGIQLFRTFLKHEERADMLDFWFVCSGFRKLEANEGHEEKKLKLAKAIYKKYILDNNGIVSRQIKPATKSFIKDCVARLHVDPAMFDQAQTEIQTMMEENTYPLFIKSDIYLEYTRTGGESPKPDSDPSSVSGNIKGLQGYLPGEQLEVDPTPITRITQKLLMETSTQQVADSNRFQDSQEYRPTTCLDQVNPYYVNTGYAMAPSTSANDSEQQSMTSDADTTFFTDSSLEGDPPYRHRKQHRREIHESAKANGRVSLPHIPRTNRIPKDIHVEPERFAAELIGRLEDVLKERHAQDTLEERVSIVRLEEDEGAELSTAAALSGHRFPPGAFPHNYNNSRYAEISYTAALPRDAHEENPESILDDHVQRVMKTPGCTSPGTGGRHPPHHHKHANHWSAEASHDMEKNHKILLWLMEGQKETVQHKRSPYGSTTGRSAERSMHPCMGTQLRNSVQPSHPFIQDPTMPPNPAPSPLIQLEEVRRRLEEEKIKSGTLQPKQRYVMEVIQRGRTAVRPTLFPPLNAVPAVSDSELSEPEPRSSKRQPCENMTVAYYFCEELIPYRTSVRGRVVSLGQFKELLTKKGNYRYYFKKVSDEFDCGVVFEEIREDDAILPIFEEKIIGKVEKVD